MNADEAVVAVVGVLESLAIPCMVSGSLATNVYGVQFKPQQVILFGSHAEGRARSGSDVDLLAVMPTNRDPIDESVAIRMAVRPPFPVDLLVRTPQMIQQQLALGDPFVRHILEHGKLLHASPDG